MWMNARMGVTGVFHRTPESTAAVPGAGLWKRKSGLKDASSRLWIAPIIMLFTPSVMICM